MNIHPKYPPSQGAASKNAPKWNFTQTPIKNRVKSRTTEEMLSVCAATRIRQLYVCLKQQRIDHHSSQPQSRGDGKGGNEQGSRHPYIQYVFGCVCIQITAYSHIPRSIQEGRRITFVYIRVISGLRHTPTHIPQHISSLNQLCRKFSMLGACSAVFFWDFLSSRLTEGRLTEERDKWHGTQLRSRPLSQPARQASYTS